MTLSPVGRRGAVVAAHLGFGPVRWLRGGTMACAPDFVDPGRGVVARAKCCELEEGLWSVVGREKCCETWKRGCRNLEPD